MSAKNKRKVARQLQAAFPKCTYSRNDLLKMVLTLGVEGAHARLREEGKPKDYKAAPFVDPLSPEDPLLRQIQLEVQRVTQGG